MTIQRTFLNWQTPVLVGATTYLFDRYAQADQADLSGVIVVVPGRRAGRRLLELLVDEAAERRCLLTPPVIETVGALPEQLYEPQRPFAGDLTQRFAWAAVLRDAGAERLQPLVARPPANDDATSWLELGELLRQQHVELAGDDLDFATVASCVGELGGEAERLRWETLAALQADYHRRLDQVGLWDRQTARRVAIQRGECRLQHDVVLVATVDMNRTTRRMLDADSKRVTALVFAGPEKSWADCFDPQGCLVAEAWQEIEIPVDAGDVDIVEGPAGQAEAVLQQIGRYEGRYRADEITVGFPDDSLAPRVERSLEAAGLPARWGPGKPCAESGPYRLLAAVAAWLGSDRYDDFAELARHPDLQDWLVAQGVERGWIVDLDAYQAEHLPDRLSGSWHSGSWLAGETNTRRIRQAARTIDDLTADLRGKAQSIREWGEPILGVLSNVYGTREWDRELPADHAVLAACGSLREAVGELSATPLELAPATTAGEAIRLVLAQVADVPHPPRGEDAAIELVGWLELPLDDAPALIVTSMNESYVPASVTSDLFLPNRVRDRLGLLNNARRYARDAYAMRLLLASDRSIDWIAARRNADGDPLFPSRLLLAADGEAVARRALRFFDSEPAHGSTAASEGPLETAVTGPFVVPRPEPLETPLTRLSVTGFRSYIACPYRFYLSQVLRLGVVDDHARELDPSGFGSLAHEALRRFGLSELRDSADAGEIERALNEMLDDYVASKFGRDASPMVRVQVEQLRLRLAAFAAQQAAWRAEGWQIEFAETSPERPGAPLVVDGEPFYLSGRIDRIDVHPDGRRAILDYKTSDAGDRPEKTHQKSGEWVDLQLPLYRHLATHVLAAAMPDVAVGGADQMLLGYIALPKDTSRTGFQLAKWTPGELEEADRVAAEVIRGIRGQIFWPPTDPPPRFSEDLAAICQDNVFEREMFSPR